MSTTPENQDPTAPTAADGPQKLLVIDGHSMAFRAFYALPAESFQTATGQHTNAVHGFVSMLISLLKEHAPTRIAVAFDVGRETFRTEMFPDYKANREASPEEFRGQVELIAQVLSAMGIAWLDYPGYEADDIIATWVTQAEELGWETAVVSGDRDTFQLVTDHTRVLYPIRGVSTLDVMTPAAVEEKYGLTPAQYPDFAALRGDKSDNLPSVPKVGEKTASKWIREYGDLANLLDHADELKGAVGQSFRDHLEQVRLNRDLTQMVRDLELRIPAAAIGTPQVDRERVHAEFDMLEFRTLRERLFALPAVALGLEDTAAAAEADSAEVISEVVVELRETVEGKLAQTLVDFTGQVGVAFAGTWGGGTGDLTTIALATPAGQALVLDPVDLNPADEVALANWLADPAVEKAIHDAKGPLLALHARGWELAGLTFDTALAAYLLRPGQRSFELADLLERFCQRPLHAAPPADQTTAQLSLELDPAQAQQARIEQAERALGTVELAQVLAQELKQIHGTALLTELELPLLLVLARMEEIGIALDLPALEQLQAEFDGQATVAMDRAHEIVGHTFNLGSPKQLQQVLFEERDLPPTKRIKTGYSTDAEALNLLYASTQDPVLQEILTWRDVTKLSQTVAGLLRLVGADGRIHSTFNQMVAATGRLSSRDPNLQNIPIRTDAGERIRAGFIPGEGFATLLTADYSQIEMRILAHFSEEENLIAAFRQGEDLHTSVAAQVFDVPVAQVTPQMRSRVKAVSYGLVYGLTAHGLSQQLGIHRAEAQELMDEYFKRFGRVRDYLTDVVEQARKDGYTQTLLGRRRYLPDLTSTNRMRREMAERMARNAPIQGSAADLIKRAMLRVDEGMKQANLQSQMLLQVHDELVFAVAPGESEKLRQVVQDGMSGAFSLSVPLDVSFGEGANWQEAGH